MEKGRGKIDQRIKHDGKARSEADRAQVGWLGGRRYGAGLAYVGGAAVFPRSIPTPAKGGCTGSRANLSSGARGPAAPPRATRVHDDATRRPGLSRRRRHGADPGRPPASIPLMWQRSGERCACEMLPVVYPSSISRIHLALFFSLSRSVSREAESESGLDRASCC